MLPRFFPGLLPHSPATFSPKSLEIAGAKPEEGNALGDLPEWNLGDLYDAPEAPALKADLEQARQDADAMHERYAGRLEALLDGGAGGDALAEAVRSFEALNDVLGRVASYASLLYAADTTDPRRQKF